MKISFGKFEGTEVEDLPTSYIEWLLNNCVLPDNLQKELQNQLELRSGSGVVRDKDYLERHSMKFKEDEQE